MNERHLASRFHYAIFPSSRGSEDVLEYASIREIWYPISTLMIPSPVRLHALVRVSNTPNRIVMTLSGRRIAGPTPRPWLQQPGPVGLPRGVLGLVYFTSGCATSRNRPTSWPRIRWPHPPAVYISDFRIARPMADHTQITVADSLVGSIDFTAPERLLCQESTLRLDAGRPPHRRGIRHRPRYGLARRDR